MDKIVMEQTETQVFIVAGSYRTEVNSAEAEKRGAEYIAEIVRDLARKSGMTKVSAQLEEFLPNMFTV